MDGLMGISATLAVLSAMITPVVLISACGSLTISTSNRLGRAIDRTRKLSDQIEEVMQKQGTDTLFEERRTLLFDQLRHITQRVRLLHRALRCLYLALGVFVATSIMLGVSQVLNESYSWFALILALGGASLLLYTCALLATETYIARIAVMNEMDFAWRLGKHYSPQTFEQRESAYKRWFRISK
jgi:hypothetical protein